MRRGGGVHALLKKKEQAEKYRERGQELQSLNNAQVKGQLEAFKMNLESFALQYKKQLQKDPEFRQYFNELCKKIGVDPLVSNKGFWGELLGVGDFYYELGVQIVEVCLMTRPINGGLMALDDALSTLQTKRGQRSQSINGGDIEAAVKQLKVLGNGFSIIKTGNKKFLQSVPYHLSEDHTTILILAQKDSFVTLKSIQAELSWERTRSERALEALLAEGMAWVDHHHSSSEINDSNEMNDSNGDGSKNDGDSCPPGGEISYWFPTLFFASKSTLSASKNIIRLSNLDTKDDGGMNRMEEV